MPCNFLVPRSDRLGGAGTGLAMGLTRPCGRCNACRKKYAADKAIRMVHEINEWPTASFLTLTYDERNLHYETPTALLPSITPRHLQLFFKRLRRKTGLDLSYVACGEYGSITNRPHYHVILYGYDFSDNRRIYQSDTISNTNTLYNSNLLDKLWEYKGHCVIADVSYDSCAYVAGYTIKKLNGEAGKSAYDKTGRLPPFGLMSRRPAIGLRWIERHYAEVAKFGNILVKGKKRSIPRYYVDYIKNNHPDHYDRLVQKQRALYSDIDINNVANDMRIQTTNNNKQQKI